VATGQSIKQLVTSQHHNLQTFGSSLIDAVLGQVVTVIPLFQLGFALGASMAGTSSLSEIEATGKSPGFVLGVSVCKQAFPESISIIFQC
jgi:hypothetical protein